ncbi:MFS transporter [Streptomyces caniscabiei]|uniref:MFS transporter n=1 Tax=Streptomyces caniscabiei TaxID=2746961 RepID=UPI0029B8B0BF|nr:MFS transporter [Streptomyces caniscabiei]MDX2776479.1 MFS transporter [Streptomyces caniscabiei]
MIRQLIHKLLRRRHFWRYATFSEVSELYASRLMRMLAINISVTFMGVFLYQNGYPVLFILAFWGAFFLFKAIVAIPAAAYAARFGPKHGIFLSNILYIPSILAFSFVPTHGISVMIIAIFFQGMSVALYDLCYMIDFSKVKSVEHAGKEIAIMNMLEKGAKGVSPFLGGLLAFAAGPQVVMWAAALLFLLSSIPLFKTAEPMAVGQKLSFKGLRWRGAFRSIAAEAVIGFDAVSSGTVWALFLAVAILGVGTGNEVYAELGVLVSVSLFAALAVSYVFGKVIDNRRGGVLLRAGVLANSVVHLARPFTGSPIHAASVNVANETATTAYMMPYIRGLFDTADILGKRVAFLGLTEVALNIGAAAAAFTACGLVAMLGDHAGMRGLFFVAAVVGLGILVSKFQLYRK